MDQLIITLSVQITGEAEHYVYKNKAKGPTNHC